MARLNYIYEVPLFYLFLFVIERSFFPDRPAFFQVSPHPYWLGIILFSFRYGLGAGLESGLVSAGLYLGILRLLGEPYFFEDPEFYILPGLFVVVGLSIGARADRFIMEIRDRDKTNQSLTGQNRLLSDELNFQKKANQTLEKQIVSQMASLVTLYEGARRLGDLNRTALMDGILDFFCKALHANKAALYLKQETRWVLHNQLGWEEGASFPKTLSWTEGLTGKSGSENKIVSLRDWFGMDLKKAWESRERADAIMAGPLRSSANEVIGVFSIQDMPFLRFNSASLNLLALLLNWAESSISRSFYVEGLKSKTIFDELYHVYNEEYFKKRSEQEFSRSKTYSLPFSLLLISFDGLEQVSQNQQIHFLRALSHLLSKVCRPIDIVTSSNDIHIPFHILMMTASHNQANELKGKIKEAWEKLELSSLHTSRSELSLNLRIGVGSYEPGMPSVDSIIDRAKQDLN